MIYKTITYLLIQRFNTKKNCISENVVIFRNLILILHFFYTRWYKRINTCLNLFLSRVCGSQLQISQKENFDAGEQHIPTKYLHNDVTASTIYLSNGTEYS